jgi:hypothetical protein
MFMHRKTKILNTVKYQTSYLLFFSLSLWNLMEYLSSIAWYVLRRPPDIEGRCQYIKDVIVGSRQRATFELRG